MEKLNRITGHAYGPIASFEDQVRKLDFLNYPFNLLTGGAIDKHQNEFEPAPSRSSAEP